jgi:hypothetical protein
MLLCEAAIFICSILMVVWDMASSEGMEGYQDMAVYTVLCSISTFLALATTLSLLLVPTHVRSCTNTYMPPNQSTIQPNQSTIQKHCESVHVSLLCSSCD